MPKSLKTFWVGLHHYMADNDSGHLWSAPRPHPLHQLVNEDQTKAIQTESAFWLQQAFTFQTALNPCVETEAVRTDSESPATSETQSNQSEPEGPKPQATCFGFTGRISGSRRLGGLVILGEFFFFFFC